MKKVLPSLHVLKLQPALSSSLSLSEGVFFKKEAFLQFAME